MALFLMILRKMVKNRWLELSLLLGLIVSVALASTMPIYTHAILQRMLVKDLETLQQDTQQYPGTHYSYVYLNGDGLDAQGKPITATDDFFTDASRDFKLPVLAATRIRATINLDLTPSDPSKVDPGPSRTADLSAMQDMEAHIRLIDGRMPAKEPVDGVYETLVAPELLGNLKLVIGNEFTINDKSLPQPVRIKPVGVFERKDNADLYWPSGYKNFRSTFFVPYELFEKDFTVGKKLKVLFGYWYYAFDYHAMKLESIDDFTGGSARIDNYLSTHFKTYTITNPALKTFKTYFDKEKRLRLMLWSLNVPVMILLAFYLFMVANLIAERQKTEIAVLRSRGASRLQMLLGYLIEGVLLGVVALAIGPWIGLYLTKMLGAANGFLEFVQRAAMDVELNREAFRYALIAVGASIVMTLLPVVLATRVSIVGHKITLARQGRMSFAHKIFIDVILMALSIYLLQSFHRRMSDLVSLGLDSVDLKVDPLLFVVPALFVLASGLLLLRVYPWLIRLVYWLGRKWWPPYLYSTLLQVGRSTTQYQFIMMFLILTMATGLFSASAARTMNQNIEDKIRYATGADITLRTMWQNDAPPPAPSGPGAPPADSGGVKELKRVQYTEPPFLLYSQLPGVESAARVFRKQAATVTIGKEVLETDLMGIDTDAFGRTAWLRDGLLDHDFYAYLNVMASNPRAVLISRSVADELQVQPGDKVSVGWSGVDGSTAIVYGIIDYWPSWNPNPALGSGETAANKETKTKVPHLVVGHLSFIQNNLAVEPYDVWLKMKPEASSQALYEALKQKNMPITEIHDTKQQLVRSKNDPFQLAINGVMTLGFLIAAGISFIGFLLYWVLSLSGRILQFGVLRAMGVSFAQIVGMLIVEQLLTSGAAVLIGVLTGNLTSELFVPLFQLSFDASTQVPPFQVRFDPRDQLNLYLIVSLMMSIGLLTLGSMLSRIKIHQAVKLGED
ncbi:ABC transporter permease [Paenibacillus athensensis]|uniref:Uncharacterized protein n=1 Tax=Paenibacillus athensensis TaxID=1967502 RepID=A0A4Y8PUI4_9BACL|nr:ABC transporter permease [Paenibacillus athensensis]MCD1261698.1 ABC transporter permease [Paenibacillus athensensis]